MKKLIVGACFLFLLQTGYSPTAVAFTTLSSGGWPSGNFTYRTNVNSFTGNLPGLALTALEARLIVANAIGVWKERTGANLTFTVGADTTTASASCTSSASKNSINDVEALTGCAPGEAPPNCFTWAFNQGYVNSSGKIVESDTCVFGASAVAWSVQAQGMPTNAKDLVGTLTHELGHALGLNHTPLTVMDSPTFNLGNTLARYPYGDDLDGIRSLYGSVSQTYFVREMPQVASTWGAEQAGIGFPVDRHVNATVGTVSSTASELLVASLDPAGFVAVDNHSYPVSGGGSWSGFSLTGANTVMRPPAVAARTLLTGTGRLEVLAFPLKQQTNASCPGIQLMYSSNAFANSNTLTFANDCTMHDPALAYDQFTDRFFLLYTRQSTTGSQNNKIMYRSARASDMNTWTSAVELFGGLITTEAPAFACAVSGSCLLTYLSAYTNLPHFVNFGATVGSGGSLNATTSGIAVDTEFKAITAAVRRVNNANQWLCADAWGGEVATSVANGIFDTASVNKSAIPFSVGGADWVEVGVLPFHRGSLAASPSHPVVHFFYVR